MAYTSNNSFSISGNVDITISDKELCSEYGVDNINISAYIDYYEEGGMLFPEVDFTFEAEEKCFFDEYNNLQDDIKDYIKIWFSDNGYVAAIEQGYIDI